MPKVSIFIPVYNAEKYLSECLDSVVGQTLKDIEIICIDDGSTDNSPQIIAEYAAKDKRIKIISKSNSGYGHTMNQGFFSASGEYVGCVDADDFADSKMFEILYDKAKEFKVDMVKADYFQFMGDISNRKYSHKNVIGNHGYYNKILCPGEDFYLFDAQKMTWTGIFKRDFIRKFQIRHNESPGASHQDIGFWFQSICQASQVYFLDIPLYRYRLDNPNSSINNRGLAFTYFDEYSFIKDFLNRNQELKSRFIYIYSLKKFHGYMYAFNHLIDASDTSNKEQFLKRFSLEFKIALKKGELNKSFFKDNEWTTLNTIIENPDIFYNTGNKSPKPAFSSIITYLPRKTISFFRCWKKYGIKHTICATIKEIQKVRIIFSRLK